MPEFPHTRVRAVESWNNYSGTIRGRRIPIFCEIEAGPDDRAVLQRHADAVRAIVRYCFEQDPPAPVRTLGSGWSFSKVLEPGQVVIDAGNLAYIGRVPREHWTDAYQLRASQGFAPIFVEGGTGIGTLNEALGRDVQLALRTSGAGNGHRIGGCIATGTHGSAMDVGALHDTVLALYLVVGPDRAVLVQPGTDAPFSPSAAAWLERKTGMPTQHVADDEIFHAALVSLGSFGFVFGVLLETTALYELEVQRLAFPDGDAVLRDAIETLDTRPLHPGTAEKPYHFDVVMHPYPSDGESNWFATLMWKRPPSSAFASPLHGIPRTNSDLMGLIAGLAETFAGVVPPLALSLVRREIASQLRNGALPSRSRLFPGQAFGPTTLPAGSGASTEIAVDHRQALTALECVRRALRREVGNDRFLLGAVAMRFVPRTRALLGMNQFDMNCFIELPSIRNEHVIAVYEAIWAQLESDGIRFTCHWGQLNNLTPARAHSYFGDHVPRWKAARRALLGDDRALQVFASAILADAGLDG
jgi:hypothetical protein